MSRHKKTIFPGSIIIIFFTFACLPGFAQTTLSVKEVLQKVQTNLPQLEAFRQQAMAAEQNINLAKNTLVPDLTVGYQAGYATYNNITGMSYPGIILPISGPPSAANNYNLVPGTALGGLVKWSPFTFGQRGAAIEKAAAQFKLATANYTEQLFTQQTLAITTYLNILYLKKAILNLESNIERSKTGLEQSLELAKAGLRPGIDTTQFQSSVAQAEIELYNTQKLYEIQLVELTRITGTHIPIQQIVLTDTIFVTQLPHDADTVSSIVSNTLYQFYESKKELSAASLKEINKSWTPKLDVWATAYSRGSAIDYTGAVNKADGWSLSRNNYGIGLQVSFPVFQFSQFNIQKRQYVSLLRSDEDLLAQVSLDISKQVETATINFRQNKRIAEKIPVQLKSASDAYKGLQLSYEAGLTDYTRLAQSQYELLQAEVGQANANLQVWRSLLDIAVAKGNLNLLLDQLK